MFRFGPWELALILLMLIPYFIPFIIAVFKRNNNKKDVLLLNMFGGWTVLGWLLALVWAIKSNRRIVD